MPKVRTTSLRRLAAEIPPSILSGAIVESADYIDELEAEMEQVKESYEDRVGDIESLEGLLSEIKEGYESEDKKALDELLRNLFSNEMREAR